MFANSTPSYFFCLISTMNHIFSLHFVINENENRKTKQNKQNKQK